MSGNLSLSFKTAAASSFTELALIALYVTGT